MTEVGTAEPFDWRGRPRTGVTRVARIVALAVAVAVTSCTSGSHRPGVSPANAPTSTAQKSAGHTSAPEALSARIALRAKTMTAGSSMPGSVIVENNTGRPLPVTGCRGLFQVMLQNDRFPQTPAWPLCAQRFTIPAGESSYPVTVIASDLAPCSQGPPHDGLNPCLQTGQPPLLPPGEYQAVLFEIANIVPSPPQITVTVTAQQSAP